MVTHKECRLDQPVSHKTQHQTGATQMKRGLRQNRFAGQQWFADPMCKLQSPSVMVVSSISECYQEAGIRDGLHFREKPLRVERSGGPSTAPAKRRNACLDVFLALSSSIRTMRPRGTHALWAT